MLRNPPLRTIRKVALTVRSLSGGSQRALRSPRALIVIIPLARSFLLFVCTAASFAVLGRAPGAITLRTRDIEVAIAGQATGPSEARPARLGITRRTG